MCDMLWWSAAPAVGRAAAERASGAKGSNWHARASKQGHDAGRGLPPGHREQSHREQPSRYHPQRGSAGAPPTPLPPKAPHLLLQGRLGRVQGVAAHRPAAGVAGCRRLPDQRCPSGLCHPTAQHGCCGGFDTLDRIIGRKCAALDAPGSVMGRSVGGRRGLQSDVIRRSSQARPLRAQLSHCARPRNALADCLLVIQGRSCGFAARAAGAGGGRRVFGLPAANNTVIGNRCWSRTQATAHGDACQPSLVKAWDARCGACNDGEAAGICAGGGQ